MYEAGIVDMMRWPTVLHSHGRIPATICDTLKLQTSLILDPYQSIAVGHQHSRYIQ